jgi:enamine deaminase RidA (YjgF/YER057c/UK114 family)
MPNLLPQPIAAPDAPPPAGHYAAGVRAGGGSPASVAKVTAYIVGVENWPVFNTVYAEAMGDARPARAVVPVPELHHGCLVEVEAIALAHGTAA